MQSAVQTCPACGRAIPGMASDASRYCPHCGTALPQHALLDQAASPPEDVIIAGDPRQRSAPDTINLRELVAMVETRAAWLQKLVNNTNAMASDREQAAAAMQDLSHILANLATQIATGHETVRIAAPGKTTRLYGVVCPACGHGNRIGARFCRACGAEVVDAAIGQQQTVKIAAPVLRLQTAAQTSIGQVRRRNEDQVYAGLIPAAVPIWLLLVADGMGGAPAGADASQMARDGVKRELTRHVRQQVPQRDEDWCTMIQAVVSQVNQEIFSRGAHDEHYRGMGTTLTMIVVCGQRMHVAHVGDSRAYLCNPDGVTDDEHQSMRLTSDHTLVARLVDIGQLTPEAARSHGQRNVLYRALGIRAAVDADMLSQPVTVGDVLVLCSDGLVQHVADDELARFALTSDGADTICQRLIDTANQRGGRDNIGVVVAQVERIAADP